ncbi:CFEM domain protein, putative [Talaromyces stipitatus ATCC 10500]|uniref:CFEM domain protein, putative n=1 Tax=Talaromyces stipitatus (strain ATCC 10500 / CBS 375.48 / QM 6759 / NRRL 1006) TaxID=441959 RepID=B8MKE5_TALSN|nr:CFEM domain protein, putative [Talaromyces stipitatus ATCC 10500]EED15300.1 CFEM domain protein, putative [Talaromyces stipitatus ATCC 10500]
MKLTTGIISGLALCVVNAAAQDLSSLPPCAKSCATNAMPASCGLDVKCICSAESFITSVSCCVAKVCDQADQQTTLQFAEQLCAGAGVTNLPSAAGCSSTASATSTADAASATSSKTTAASSAVTSAPTSASVASSATSSKTTTGSASAASTTHTGAASAVAKGNGVAAAGAGAAAILAMCFV